MVDLRLAVTTALGVFPAGEVPPDRVNIDLSVATFRASAPFLRRASETMRIAELPDAHPVRMVNSPPSAR